MTETTRKAEKEQPAVPRDGNIPPFPGYTPPYAVYEEDDIDLLEMWQALVRQRSTILLMVLLTTAVAVAYAFLKTPVYRAEVLMVPMSGEQAGGNLAGMLGEFGGLASLAGIDIAGGESGIEESLATLRSRRFTNQFITDNSLLPVLFDDDWDPVKKVWTVEDPGAIPSDWDAYDLFDEDIRYISKDKKTGLVTLSIEWKDRNLAARWANELVERVNRHRQQEAIAEAEKSIAYLNEQLVKTTVIELQQAVYRLIEAQTKTIMLANVREEYAFKVIDPAVVPDEGEFEKPKRPLVIALGFVGGGMLGFFLAFVRSFIQKQKTESRGREESGKKKD